MADDIATLRAAGFTDEEIGSHNTAQRDTLAAAGFSPEEIDGHIGTEPPSTIPKAFLSRLDLGGAMERTAGKIGEGVVEGFGHERLGMSDDTERAWREIGILPKPGDPSPIRLLNAAIMKPAAIIGDTIARAINAGVFGLAGAGGQAAEETGLAAAVGKPGQALSRDIVALANDLMMRGGGTRFSRIERGPHGEPRDIDIGGIPKAEDFANAEHVITGEPPREPPIVQFRRDAENIEAVLADPDEGLTRLWRGNRLGEVGKNPSFTNDLPGIALPFRRAYGGDLSYVDVPTGELPKYLSTGVVAEGAEFILPPDIASGARSIQPPDFPAISMKLLGIWQDKGIHPAEVAADASRDVTVTQDLAAENKGLPDLYGGGGEPPKPPEPPAGGEPPGPEPMKELPAPPEPGSIGDALGKVLSKISIGARDPGEKLSFQRIYTLLVDDMNPIKEAIKDAIGKTAEKELSVAENPYALFRLTRGMFGKADQMLERGTFDFNTYETNGPGLKEILEPASGDLNGLRAYAASRRALEMERRGLESGIDLDAARQVATELGDRFGPIMDRLVAFQNSVTKYLRDAGLVTPEGYQAMLAANKQYVPFYRVMDPELRGTGQTKGLGARNPLKALKGSERDIIDPLESIIKNTYAYVALAEKNAAGIKLVDTLSLAKEVPLLPFELERPVRELAGGEPMQIEGKQKALPKPEPESLPALIESAATELSPEIKEWADAHGVSDAAARDLSAIFRLNGPDDGFTIRIMRDGKVEEYKVERELARAWRALDRETIPLLVKMLAVPARALRAGATLTPDFVARNGIRDFTTAFINSKGLFSPIDTLRGFMGLVARDADFENWLKGGGANSAMVSLDRQYLQENLFKLDQETGVGSRAWNVVDTFGRAERAAAQGAIFHPIAMLRVMSEMMENATRLGEFKKIAGGVTDKATIQEAAFASREVTLDFSRMGASASIRSLNMITAFMNANIQGTDRMIREAGSRPFNFAAKVTAGITLPSILLWAANHDDPRWKEIPRWEKDVFWIVMTENHIFRIPKDFVTGVVFGSVPERILDAYYDERPDAFKDLQKTLVQSFLPNGTPNFAQPIIEQTSNMSLFTGARLVPDRLEKGLPEYEYNPYTTETAKKLASVIAAFPGMRDASIGNPGDLMNGVARALTTPVLLENYLRAWTGGLGMYALQAADAGLRKAGVVPDPPKPADTLADVPFVKAFVVRYPSASAQSIRDFYEKFEEQSKVWTSIQQRIKEGDVAAVMMLQEFKPSAMARAQGVKDGLAEHSTLVRMITQNPQIAPDEKRQLIDTLYFSMIEMARQGNAQIRASEAALGKPPDAKPVH